MQIKIPTYVYLIIGGFVVLVLGALAGWYFYLHGQSQAVAVESAGRDLGANTPSFGTPTGSTQADQAIAMQSFDSSASGETTSGSSSSPIWKIDPVPVAGMGFVTSGSSENIYYIERANGYVFSAQPASRSVARLTDTLMPKVYTAQFAHDGSFLEQSIDASGAVATFLGSIASSSAATTSALTNSNTPSTLSSVVGNYIDSDIRAIALNPTTRSIFYTVGKPGGGVAGMLMQWGTGKKKQMFSSALGSWIPLIAPDGSIILELAPADGVPGFAYALQPDGSLSALVRNIPGLTILPSRMTAPFFYGSSGGTGLAFFGVATSSTRSFPIATAADKCVWVPGSAEMAYCAVPNGSISGDYLDDRAKGFVHTSDDWWRIDLSTGQAQRIYSPSADNISFDVAHPIMSPSGTYITFINAVDQSLWVLRVGQ